MDDEHDDRSAVVRGALVKAVVVIAVIGIVIALGTTVLVRALGLNGSDGEDPVGAPSAPSPLPTTALPDTEQPTETPSLEPTDEPSSTAPPTPRQGARGLVLEVSPVIAGPGERINLTGTYRKADNVQLAVQRFEDGSWKNFDASATVKVGTFSTYVLTSRVGESRFRVYDPQARRASNEVRVTIQ